MPQQPIDSTFETQDIEIPVKAVSKDILVLTGGAYPSNKPLL